MSTFLVIALVFAGFVRAGSSTNGATGPTGPTGPDWHALYVKEKQRSVKRLKLASRFERQRNDARRTLLHRGTVTEALNLACATYGHCSELWRKARCESHLFRYAHNSSGASGLFQFLPSTFRSTPYGGFSIWSPYANALAAGWMHVHGRSGEWVCQ